MSSQKIYVVTTEGDEEGKTTHVLGYATGKPEHIRAFYDPHKTSSVALHEVAVLDITPESILARRGLEGQKHNLEEKLHRIEHELRALQGEAA